MRHFLNLTNGLAWAREVPGAGVVRISSTACEQKRWSDVIADLDVAFLLALACGEEVVVYDCGASKDVSRAVWQALPFIRAACSWRWYQKQVPVIWRGHNATAYAANVIRHLSRRAKKRLDYFRHFTRPDGTVLLTGRSRATAIDGNRVAFASEYLATRPIGQEFMR